MVQIIKANTISDRVSKVTFYNPQTGFIILKTEEGATLTGVHHGDDDGDLKGIRIIATGEWKKHKTFGYQFCFTSLEIREDPLFYFLTKIVKGIGPKLAKQIIKKFGSAKLEKILDENPYELALIKGIKGKKIGKISESWKKYKYIKNLIEYLTPFGVTSTLTLKIYDYFKETVAKENFNLINAIKDNIYILTKVPGIGFKKADQIALASGVSPLSNNRIEACIEFVIMDYMRNEGNSCIDTGKLSNLVKKETELEGKFRVELDSIDNLISQMTIEEKLAMLDEFTVTLPFLKHAEETILDVFTKKSNFAGLPINSDINQYVSEKEKQLGFAFSKNQKQAIIDVNEGRKAFILYGYAGTGKSTIAKGILDLLNMQYPYEQIMCCALSGIASDKIRKTTGYQAATIQSLLVKSKTNKKEGKELPYEVLLIDEASMINSEIMYKILKAMPDRATIILVGDPAQLPPIGSGNPFSDLIDSNRVGKVELTQIYRQSEDSVITLFANQIREAIVPENFMSEHYSDWLFEDISIKDYWTLKNRVKEGSLPQSVLKESRELNNQKILARIQDIAISASKNLQTFLHEKEYNRFVSYFQIISPMKGGVLGVENINSVIQSTINPRSNPNDFVKLGLTNFRIYDKVIHVVNKVMPCYLSFSSMARTIPEKQKIFNGMIGIIFGIDHEDEIIYIYYPADDLLVEYDFEQASEMVRLAYALTSHKTQGSQYQNVIIPMTFSHYIMSNIKMFYTAITRAEKNIILLGESGTFKTGCKRVDVVTRDTIIQRKISKMEGKKIAHETIYQI